MSSLASTNQTNFKTRITNLGVDDLEVTNLDVDNLNVNDLNATNLECDNLIVNTEADIVGSKFIVANGNVELVNDLDVPGFANINQVLSNTIQNATSTQTQSLAVTNDTQMDGNLLMTAGNLTLNTGQITLQDGNVQLNGVSALITVDGNVTTGTGNITSTDGNILMTNGNIEATNGGLTIGGVSNLNNDVNITGDVDITGNVEVTGDADINGDVEANKFKCPTSFNPTVNPDTFYRVNNTFLMKTQNTGFSSGGLGTITLQPRDDDDIIINLGEFGTRFKLDLDIIASPTATSNYLTLRVVRFDGVEIQAGYSNKAWMNLNSSAFLNNNSQSEWQLVTNRTNEIYMFASFEFQLNYEQNNGNAQMFGTYQNFRPGVAGSIEQNTFAGSLEGVTPITQLESLHLSMFDNNHTGYTIRYKFYSL